MELSEQPVLSEYARGYFEGLRDGIRRWAWWKDGQQFVGSCGTTLEQALNSIALEELEHIGKE